MKHPLANARWICSSLVGGPSASAAAPYFRKAFHLKKKPVSARLHITALGLYEAEINGQRVGDQVFAPGWTDYRTRVSCQSHDIAALLNPGENVVGALLGDGWYCGHIGWMGRRRYGDHPALLASLEIRYKDGGSETLSTDTTWQTAAGPILQGDFLMGEEYDARFELADWSRPGCDTASWNAALAFQPDPVPELCDAIIPPVRRMGEIIPDLVPEESEWRRRRRRIYDFRQNFSGRIRIRVKSARGTVLRFRFAEILNPDGSLYTENLRSARCMDTYTCKGGGEEIWESRFTFHGFRYVEADVLSLGPDDSLEIIGVVLHSDTPPTGQFRCSNELLNQLQQNIVWGQKSNFLEVPTDCPQRDERLGWTGDAQVFIRTAAFNMDVRDFFHKWMRDARDAQQSHGGIPAVIPNVFAPDQKKNGDDGGPAWSDANIICPWTIYLCYGDRRILEDHYDSMRRYFDFLKIDRSRGLIRSHPDLEGWLGYGDWLALDDSGKTEGGTPRDLIGTAFLAYDCGIMARISDVLGRDREAASYRKLHGKIVRAFQRRFVTPEGLLVCGTQTSHVLALHFDLLPENLRAAAAAALVRDIEARGFHLSTGFVGTPYLLDVLENTGHLDIAYRLLEQETFPSWLFPVKNGATTIWERWDGWTPDKGFQTKGMNSFNHYAYGAVGNWMYKTVAGLELDPEEPGYRHILFRPRPGGSITWAEASLDTAHGKTAIRWEMRKNALHLKLTVPADARASLLIPEGFAAEKTALGPGIHKLIARQVS